MRRLIGPGLVSAAMLAILLALGFWQVRRLAWKEGVLARIAEVEAGPATPLPPGVTQPSPYEKVRVTGRFKNGSDALYGLEVRDTLAGPVMGAQVVTPLLRPEGPPLLVERGWARTDRPTPPPPEGDVTVEGYVRAPDTRGLFSVTDDLAARHFYTLVPTAIGAALGVPDAAPFALVELGKADGGVAPAETLPRPTNDHLAYAVTWFSLAGVLVAMFGFWTRKALRA